MLKKILGIILLSSLITLSPIYPLDSAQSQANLQVISQENIDMLQLQTILGCNGGEDNLCDQERGVFAQTISFSPDSSIVGALLIDGTIRLWNVNGTSLGTLDVFANDFEINPNGEVFAAGTSHEVILFDSTTFSEISRFSIESMRIAFDPTGNLLVGVGSDATLWNLTTGEMLNYFDIEERPWSEGWPAWAVAYSPNGQLIAVGRLGPGDIKIWNVEQLETPVFILNEHNGPISSLVFNPDSTLLASTSEDTTLRLWDMTTGEQVTSLSFRSEVWDAAFSPDGSLLAVASGHTVSIFDVGSMDKLVVLVYPPGRVYSVTFSPDGKLLAVGAYKQGVQLWGTLDIP